MTAHFDHVKASVLALNRHQVRALVKSAQARNQAAMDVLEESWEAVYELEPDLTTANEALCEAGQADDLARFQGFGKDEDRETSSFLMGPAVLVPRVMTGVGLLLVVAFGLGAVIGLTPVPQLLLAVLVAVGLILSAGVMTARTVQQRFDHVFQNPRLSAEHVWVAATDAALALALEQRGYAAEHREHLGRLTEIWTEAGLSLDMLREPVRHKLAA